MKKVVLVLTIVALSFLAISCQKKTQETTPAQTTDTTAVVDTAKAAN